ncbi:hypothetical protein AC249_AIPGENE9994 [Exaiptasia diaphana]|nr:hypothetical protein AC249_AIPGENE9994 [Exaiptasia diaphana]
MACSFGSSDSCGSFRNESMIVPLTSCDRDITPYLTGLGICLKRKIDEHGNLSEKDLILNRAGRFGTQDQEYIGTMTICPRHRAQMTFDWPGRKRSTCCHPLHSGPRKQLKNFRRVNANMSLQIFHNHNAVVPIGSAICNLCRLSLYKKDADSTSLEKASSSTSVAVVGSASTSALPQQSMFDITPPTISFPDQETSSVSTGMIESATTSAPLQQLTSDIAPAILSPEQTSSRTFTALIGSASTSAPLQQLTSDIAPTISSPEQVSSEASDILSSPRTITSDSQSTASIDEQEISIWQDEKEEQNRKRNTLNNAFSNLSEGRISPLQSTLNTEWDDISSTQQKYYLRKAKELFQSSLTVISPGQEDKLWKSLRQESQLVDEEPSASKIKHFDLESDLIDTLVKAHNEAQSWQTKRQILSLFANDFSRSELQKILPGLSKWRIDQARDHATKAGRGQPIAEKTITRTRIENDKVEHFIDFISRPEYLQDVAFGTKTLKLDSGERIAIPAVVRTVIPTRIIEQYMSFCKQQQFQPAGERSLYRILDVCSASMQKSLQGLDNVTAEGTEAIESLLSIVQELSDHGADRCESIDICMRDVEDKIQDIHIDEELRSRLKFEFNQSNTAIRAWKAHLLRTLLQEEAKQDAMRILDDETCLVVIDWAMKFLPIKYRETMSDFFGKRGLSWHVSAVVTRSKDKYDVECFVHIFNSCTQNNYAVASILDHLFKIIKTEYPLINKAYLRSDNAGCYHNSPLILYLSSIGARSGVSLLRYDFSEPQAGKDICDRKTAPMKAHIRRFVNEKHDVVSAEDMKTALESHGGLKGCRITVVELDSSKDLQDDNKIPGISLLYNFSYEQDGIRMWKAYGIGKGGLLPRQEVCDSIQRIDDLKVILPFSQRMKDLGTVQFANTIEPAQLLFGCNELTCILTFKSEKEAQAHMDTGKHLRELESVSVYDKIRLKWAERVTGVSGIVDQPEFTRHSDEYFNQQQQLAITDRSPLMGWALKITKERRRFEDKVKAFLIEKFEAGEKSGNEADPLSVSKEMKVKRDAKGELLFKPEEWKTAQQIKSFFSRHSARTRKMKIGELRGEALDDEITEDDIESFEAELNRLEIHNAVDVEINKLDHPIVIDEINVCQISNNDKLNSLKIGQLKSLCKSLQLKIEGSQTRKKSFVDPLKELVKKCTCQK